MTHKVAELVQNKATGKYEGKYNGQVLASSFSASYVMESIKSGRCNKAKRMGITDIVDKTGGIAFTPVAAAVQHATGEVAGETPSIAATRFPINKRFELLEFYTEMVAKREQPSLLVTGPGGLGKTYSVLAKLQELGILNSGDCGEVIPPDGDGKNGTLKPSESKKYYTIIKGYSTPKGLYRTLFENQNRLVIFDDCDSVLRDPTALNLLKGALDSYEKRVISWHSESIRDDGLPSSFNFSGSVIFISNYPMHKIDQAVKTRAIPVDLTMSNEQKIERMEVIVQNEQFLPSYAPELKQKALELLRRLASEVPQAEINFRSLITCTRIAATGKKDWEMAAEYAVLEGDVA
jgi:hypothetical protein